MTSTSTEVLNSTTASLRGTLISAQNPVIFYIGSYASHAEPHALSILADALINIEVIWLILVAWDSEKGDYLTNWRKSFSDKYSKHRFIFLANTYAELQNLKANGNETLLHNQNMFVDRNLFKPIPLKKTYAAVYNAQFLEFKRHYLCSKLKDLILIGYNFESPFFLKTMEELPFATFANIDKEGKTRWLMQNKVNEIYNASCVGLCLSRTEGAMHASMEYLLSGIPIVTTLSTGGRDYYFDGRFVLWVDDNPIDISNAVNTLASQAIDPNFIRNETLAKIDKELDRFILEVSNFLGIGSNDFAANFKYSYNDKLLTPTPVKHLLGIIN